MFILSLTPRSHTYTLGGRCNTIAHTETRALYMDLQACGAHTKTRSSSRGYSCAHTRTWMYAKAHVDIHACLHTHRICGWTKQWCVFLCVCAVDCWQPVHGELVRSQHTQASLLPASLTTSGCVCVGVCVCVCVCVCV